MTGKIWFVGAGPGDPDLMTVKARKLLEQSGAVLFAGSLVDQAATLYAPTDCEIRDSKDMTLEQMSVWLLDAHSGLPLMQMPAGAGTFQTVPEQLEILRLEQ